MPRLSALDETNAPKPTQRIFAEVREKLGRVPNLYRGLGHGPAALSAYLAGQAALEETLLSPAERETIALVTSQLHHCDYCLAAHTAVAKTFGLDEAETLEIRRFSSPDERRNALAEFTRDFVEARGWVGDEQVDDLRAAGFSDGEIAEIPAVVALTTLSNWFNHLNETEVDFPVAAAV